MSQGTTLLWLAGFLLAGQELWGYVKKGESGVGISPYCFPGVETHALGIIGLLFTNGTCNYAT